MLVQAGKKELDLVEEVERFKEESLMGLAAMRQGIQLVMATEISEKVSVILNNIEGLEETITWLGVDKTKQTDGDKYHDYVDIIWQNDETPTGMHYRDEKSATSVAIVYALTSVERDIYGRTSAIKNVYDNNYLFEKIQENFNEIIIKYMNS